MNPSFPSSITPSGSNDGDPTADGIGGGGSGSGSGPTTYKPTKPKMGDLLQTGATEYVPWTGGTSLHDWTTLEAAPSIIRPTMLRPTLDGSSQKSQAYRTLGLTPNSATMATYSTFRPLFLSILSSMVWTL